MFDLIDVDIIYDQGFSYFAWRFLNLSRFAL